MLTAIRGYYDGKQIVVDEQARKILNLGDQLLITILDKMAASRAETLAEKRRLLIDEKKYVRPSGRSAEEIDAYVRELRDSDRVDEVAEAIR